MTGVKILGTGSYVPPNIVSNDELQKFVDTNDEWIRTRTGIRERRISQGENTSDMAAKAAIEALNNAKIKVEDIDLLIVATTSPDCFTPSTACIVQEIIGAENAVAFDIGAACSGFIFALNTAVQYLKGGERKTALVIGAEMLSKLVDWNDRNTCVLFGDGAGAVVIKTDEKEAILSSKIGSDGRNGRQLLNCSAATLNNPYIEGAMLNNKHITMNGKEVFKFAVRIIEKTVNELLDAQNLKIEEIKYIVPHQANIRIIETAAKKLGIAEEKFYVNLYNYGNTSGASIPITLDEMNRKGMLKSGDKIITVGFGGGLTWGGILIEW